MTVNISLVYRTIGPLVSPLLHLPCLKTSEKNADMLNFVTLCEFNSTWLSYIRKTCTKVYVVFERSEKDLLKA